MPRPNFAYPPGSQRPIGLSLFQTAGSFSVPTSLSAAVTGLPAILARTKYAREFETAADTFAFDLLKHKGRSPEAFATIMTKLADKEGQRATGFNYLSTHPVTEERVPRARDAAP